MNPRPLFFFWTKMLASVFAFAWIVGCSSAPKTYPGPDGVTYMEAEHVDRVWVEEGFDFTGYDTLLIEATEIEGVTPKDEKEKERLDLAQVAVTKDLEMAIELQKLFPTIVRKAENIKEGSKALRLQSSIIKFSRGSTTMRVMVGFGAGNPYLRVRGRLTDMADNKPKFLFEIEEDGHVMEAVWVGSKERQMGASWELAEHLAEFMSKVSKHETIEYED